MAVETVECERVLAADPGTVWALVGEFSSDWHPAILICSRKIEADGSEVRHFTGADGGKYRERLTYLSHSDRTFQYSLTDGIVGIQSYEGAVHVLGENDATRVTWRARIEAPADRISAIADGTRTIFEAGLDWLAEAEFHHPTTNKPMVAELATAARREQNAMPRLSWLHSEAEEGDTLTLFLHGIGGNAENWSAQLSALGAQYRVAALDLRGYGRSDLGSSQTTIEDHCADILRLMQTEGAERVILVGLSMGSWIATSFAMRHPEKLAGLVLAAGCTGMSEASIAERNAFLSAREKPLAEGKSPADFADDVVHVIAGPNADEEARNTLRASMQAIAAETYRDALVCFANPTERFDFSRIACPVLMMTGEHDILAPPVEIREVSRRIHAIMKSADMRFEVISDAGHVCNFENPEAFNHHLSDFLERVVAHR